MSIGPEHGGINQLEDAIEQARAEKQYHIQVVAFRKALSVGDIKLARKLVSEYDWERDMITQELHDWFES